MCLDAISDNHLRLQANLSIIPAFVELVTTKMLARLLKIVED